VLEFARLAAFRNEVIGWIDEAKSFTKPAKSNVPLGRVQLTPPGGARALRFRPAWVSAMLLWVKRRHVRRKRSCLLYPRMRTCALH
jgi:hypothetical protein